MHNYYYYDVDNIDVQKMRDDAEKRLRAGEESTIHYHKPETTCDMYKHREYRVEA